MFFKLLRNDWLSNYRSTFWTQSVIQNTFLGLFAIYIIIQLVTLGFFGGYLIEEYFPNQNPVTIANRFLIYYVLWDLIIRSFLQKYPSLQIQPYLVLNVKKKQLAQYLCLRSILSFFNIAPLFFLIPFYFMTIQPELGVANGLKWLLMLFLVIGIVHYLSYYLDRNLGKSAFLSLGFLGVTGFFLSLDYYGYFSLSEIFTPVFNYFSQQVLGLFILLILLCGVYFLVYRFLYSNAYLPSTASETGARKIQNLSILNRFDTSIGTLIQLEIKLILRNKRAKAYLMMSFFFLLYPLLFFDNDDLLNEDAVLIMVGLLLTGSFTLNYAQLFFSWNSPHFDFILAQNISSKDYIEAKFVMLAISNVVFFILALPYGIFVPKMIGINLVMLLFNTGVTIFVYIYLAFYHSKYMDSNKGGAFSFEGFDAAHFLIIIPLLFGPLLIYLPFRLMNQGALGIILIGFIGLMGIVFRNYLLGRAVQLFNERRYKLNAGFKAK